MADSLILKGVKDVRKHAGTEMQIVRPNRGGDTWHLKEWWKSGVTKCYVDCTVFNVTTADGTVKLALDTNMGTDVRIDHDGAFNFAFYGINEVRRAALFDENFALIEHYLFPSISGGKIVTVTPAGGADRPSGTPATNIGTVTVSGTTAVDADTEYDYTASNDGNAGGLSYTWSVSGGSASISSGQGTGTVTVDVGASSGGAEITVSCVVNSSDEGITDDGASGSATLTVN